MGKDTPDWGGLSYSGFTWPLTDMAELAARLGAPIVYDRRGSYLWHTNFADGIGAVDYDSGGVHTAPTLDASTFETPPYSLKMATAASPGKKSHIFRFLNVPYSHRCAVALPMRVNTHDMRVTLTLSCSSADGQYSGIALIDLQALTVTISDGALGAVVVIPDLPDFISYPVFEYIRLSCDFKTGKYIRLTVGDVDYDLSAYSLVSYAPATYHWLELDVLVSAMAAYAAAANIDRIVATADEP